ncbi:off-track [Carabus blaptoides fortunei]
MKIKISVITVIFVAHIIHAEDERYFSRSPKNVDVIAGRNITLPCEVTPGHDIRYYWELNGHPVANTTRRYQHGSDLHITRADRERDSGHFTCIAQDAITGLSITSSEAALNIHWIGNAEVQLQTPDSASYITAGSDVILRCHLDASGDIRYEWFRNADRLTKTGRLELRKKRLHIKSVNPSDNGVYRCTAINEAGSVHSTKNFALAVPGDQTALIQTVPINQLVKKGSSAQFDCVYQHSNVIEWYFKDVGPLESNDRITVLSNGTLQISNVQESDQGIYNCVGIRAESTEVPQSYIAELKVAYLENLSINHFEPPLPANQTIIAPEGSLFQQTCLPPYSLPSARQWWLNSGGHTISDSGTTRVDDGRLIIDKVESTDAGKYTCVAENMASKSETAVTLIVTTKPVINADPESITVDENTKSVLTCGYDAMAEPYTTVKWRKDAKLLRTDSDNGHQRIKNFKQNGTLMIQNTKISDRGEYKCEIHTQGFAPVVSKPATISVIEILKFAPPPVSKNLELGSMGKVHCKAQGTPPPLVHWERYPNGSDGFESHVTDMNGTLHFNGVLAEDKGKYICYASNSQGTINTTINIEVVVAPKFSVMPKNPTEAIEGYSVMIDCVVEGDPKPMIQWDKNSRMNDFDKSRFRVLTNGTLYISEVYREDENNYGCTAGNSAGLNRKEIRLIVHSGEGYRPDINVDDLENEGAMITKAVLITMSVAGAYMILVIGLMVWCRYRRKARKLAANAEDGKVEIGEGDHENTELKENVNGHIAGPSKPVQNGIDSIHKEGQKSDGGETAHSQSSGHSKKSKTSYDKIALSRQNLKDMKPIGRGEFGEVMLAKIAANAIDKRSSTASTPTGDKEDKEMPVLVKSLTQTKDDECLAEFKRELDLFHKMNHENVSKLLGLCRETEPHYMILEHTDWGDLKQFLIATQKGGTTELTIPQCVAVIHQLAKGMEHLSNNRLVHKDLAARNCLITSALGAKISMARMIKEPYSQEYCKHLNQLIPLRWLPHEAVFEDEYSTKSDVYAFGVLIWEIFSQGELPLSKISDTTLIIQLKEKQLQWKSHKATPTEMQQLQEICWAESPTDRPYFIQIVQTLSEILKSQV